MKATFKGKFAGFRAKAKQKEKDLRSFKELPRMSPEEAEAWHSQAMAGGARCKECPLFGLRLGPVFNEIRPNKALMVLAESPGDTEVATGQLLSGETGRHVDKHIAIGGVEREEASLANVQLCRPPMQLAKHEATLQVQYNLALDDWREAAKLAKKNKQPVPPKPDAPKTPAQCCAPYTTKEIDKAAPKVLLTLGKAALRAAAQHYGVPHGSKAGKTKTGQVRLASLKKQLGAPTQIENGPIVVATYHPAHGMRKGSRHLMHIIQGHIERAAKIAVRGRPDWDEPAFVLEPNVTTIETLLRRFRERAPWISVDIETNKGNRPDGKFDPFSCHIRCVGIGAVIDGKEEVIVVPVRRRDGSDWWTTKDEKLRVIAALVDLLNNVRIVGHNFSFDSSVLLRLRILRDRRMTFDDTILMHHDSRDNDAPHDLAFVGQQYLEVPHWKHGADEKFFDNVTDYDLHHYCARDVLVVMRLKPILEAEVLRWGTQSQYDVDVAMAPHFRNMGDLGLFVDERQRGVLSVKMGEEATARLKVLTKIVGDPNFNPNSPPQIRTFLFKKRKLKPEVSTKQKDWEEGDDPSTNSPALQRILMKQRPDDETKTFINTLIELRQYRKLQGTYLNKLPVTYPDWKEYPFSGGVPVGRLEEVRSEVWVPWSKKETVQIIEETGSEPDEPGRFETRVVIPERPDLSRLFISYKIHIVPSGRSSSSPNAQNYPSQGKANMRKMIIAPPGHVLVGADFDQLELRIYAELAQDTLLLKCFTEKLDPRRPDGRLDPHSWNAATLFHKKYGVSMRECYEMIEHDRGKKFRKDHRNIAKTFCLAEGTKVLTHVGQVPIEHVQRWHKVWDGHEWVTHDGVVYQGTKEVITYDGVGATPDHKVWTEDGRKVELRQARAAGLKLARTGDADRELRLVGPDWACSPTRKASQGTREMSRLWGGKADVLRQSKVGKVERVSSMFFGQEDNADVASLSRFMYATALRESAAPKLGTLRRKRGGVSIFFDGGRSLGNRPNRQQWALRARQPAMGDTTYQHHESDQYRVGRDIRICAERLAFHEGRRHEEAARGHDSRGSATRSPRVCSGAKKLVARGSRKVRVYDILNAGPRRRFTANGRLVSNCYLELYGGEPDKLFAYMAVARDKATGELMFPGLLREDVDEWHTIWHRDHPQTKQWQKICESAAGFYGQGFTATAYGCYRRRYFPGGSNKPGATFNHVGQGTGAEFANEALLYIAERIPFGCWSPFTGLMSQIHDQIIVCVPVDKAEYARRVIKEAMNRQLGNMPITASPGISFSWADQEADDALKPDVWKKLPHREDWYPNLDVAQDLHPSLAWA